MGIYVSETPLTGPNEPRYHITLTRGMKGVYGWELSCRGDSADAVFTEIQNLDTKLRALYSPMIKEE